MAMIIVLLNKPESLVRGVLRNAFYEPQPNVFVGSLDKRRLDDLHALLADRGCDAMVIRETNRKGSGFAFNSFGCLPNRTLVEIDGLQFVHRITRTKSKT